MTGGRFCPSCGVARIEGARFCGACGADLEALGAPPLAQGPAPAQPGLRAAPSADAPSRGPRRQSPVAVAVLVLIVAGGIGAYLVFGRSSVTYAGIFSPTGSMTAPRWGQSATLLPDGRVLIAGGQDGSAAALSSAELYDPRTATFSPTGSMTTARWGQSATLLPDGRFLVAGGDGSTLLSSAELFR